MPRGPKGERRPADVIGSAQLDICVRKTLRVTPAMAASLSDTVIDWAQIVDAMDADPPAPAKSAIRNLTIPDHAKGEFNDALQALALGGIYRRLVSDVRPIGHA